VALQRPLTNGNRERELETKAIWPSCGVEGGKKEAIDGFGSPIAILVQAHMWAQTERSLTITMAKR
jgi:hypothetical protein